MRDWARSRAVLLMLLAGGALAPLTGAAAETDTTSLADRCQACHQGGFALSRFDTDSLIEKIGRIQNVPGQHASLLAGADEARIAALAERLAGNFSEADGADD